MTPRRPDTRNDYQFSLRPTGAQKFGWLFSRAGRLRRRIAAVAAAPTPAARAALADDLLARLGSGRAGATADAIADGLLSLASAALDARDPRDAARLLDALDASFPEREERLPLRFECLAQLRDLPDPKHFLAQARAMFRDPLCRWPDHANVVTGVVAAAHAKTDAAGCVRLIESAHAGLRAAPPLQAVLALCQCPAAYASPEQAREWVARLGKLDLGFSPQLQADQRVEGARAAEHAGDGAAAAELAARALEALPSGPRARYWAARTRLYLPRADAAGLPPIPPGPGPEWQRLKLLAALHEAPSPAAARAAVAVLDGTLGPPDAGERKLTQRLMRAAIGFDPAHSTALTKVCAEVARFVTAAVGPAPWSELAIAAGEIRAERNFAAAAARLAAPPVAAQPLAGALAWLARVAGRRPAPTDFDPAIASAALGELDRQCPRWRDRVAARWEWLTRLLAANRIDTFCAEAPRFLADSLVDSGLAANPNLGKAVRQIVATLYDRASPAACGAACAAAGPAVRDLPEVRAALALSECPPRFSSNADVMVWLERLSEFDLDLDFSPAMKADSLLVTARAMEWAEDARSMEARAEEALAAKPDHAPAAYWLARARLYRPGSDPRAVFTHADAPDTDEWARLRCMAAVYDAPTIDAVRALLLTVEERPTNLDAPEKAQIAGLVAGPLTASADWTTGELADRVELCQTAARELGPYPWITFTLAVANVRLSGDYARAIRSFDEPAVRALPDADTWAALARILAGTPADRAGDDPLARLERGIAWLQVGTGDDTGPEGGSIERWVRAVPALGEVAKGLEFARLACADPATARAREWQPDARAPEWVRWACARLALVAASGDGSAPVLRHLAHEAPAALWRELYGPHDGPPPTAVEFHPDRLGGFAPLAVRDRELTRQLALVRQSLADGHDADAMARCGELAELVGSSPLLKLWWQPIIEYWRACAQTRTDPHAAKGSFAALLGSHKRHEAAGQLALLAVRDGDLPAAAAVLDPVPPRYPGVAYAKALLHERRGEPVEARELLARFPTAFPAQTHYHRAAARLLAAIEERQENLVAAVDRYRAALESDPTDAVAARRLARAVLRTGSAGEVRAEVPGLLAVASGLPFPATPRFELLLALTAADADGLTAVEERLAGEVPDPEERRPWAQALARRYLEAGDAGAAHRVLAACAPGGTDAHRAGRLVLRAWDLFRTAWREPARREELPALAGEFAALAGTDEMFGRWRVLVDEAAKCADGSAPAAWGALAPWPLAALPGLWSEVEKDRTAAAAALTAALAADPALVPGGERDVLKAVCAAVLGKDDELLALYGALEPALTELPVEPAGVWHAAACVWFRRKNWKALLEGDLPECVADLADPQVRLLIGLAYAASAAESAARDDVRRALADANRGRATLEGVVG